MNDRLNRIRESERKSHIETYSNQELYREGSWLRKPIKTVLDILPLLDGREALRVLDLGCGVGRNALAVAKYFQEMPSAEVDEACETVPAEKPASKCMVECVDLLELAIEKLQVNAEEMGVSDAIEGVVVPIEEFEVAPDQYDLIMAVSALEHIDTRESFERKLQEIGKGIRPGGVVCLVINSEVSERDKETGEAMEPQFEVNLSTQELQELLKNTFVGWEVLKSNVRSQHYDIPRENGISELRTNVVTYVVQRQY